MSKRRRPIKLSLRKKLLFAVGATVLFFGLLELVLAGLGVSPEATSTDRMVGFSNFSPLLVQSTNSDGEVIMSTAQNKLHWFNHQSFVKRKAPNVKRVFCMGGSTTYGHPYWDETSFAGWLRHYLPVVDPQHKWEVINAGGISYGSYRVAALMENSPNMKPTCSLSTRRTTNSSNDTLTLRYSISQLLCDRRRIYSLVHEFGRWLSGLSQPRAASVPRPRCALKNSCLPKSMRN